ncbi:MAG TPA: TolC family protein [Terriglobales bacterium]|nr:TolC family protein [Terriglobales bacterium]
MRAFSKVAGSILALGLFGIPAVAQEVASPAASQSGGPAPVALTLKKTIDLALENSKDIQLAKIQERLADHSALISRAAFLPNLYAGSGAGYTYGIPETPGGRAPSIFSVTYNEQIFNEPLRGQARELQEQAHAQKINLEDVRNTVIAQTASAYLELVKVRHSRDLLEKEKESAERILAITQEREGQGFELPMEVTRAELTQAQIAQRILQLEDRDDELSTFLRNQAGLGADQPIDLAADDLPGAAEQEGDNLLALALENNSEIRIAESDVRAKEFRLKGEKRGYWPTLALVSIYSRLATFNNYEKYFQPNTFQPNNYNAGVDVQVPIFSPAVKANVGVAEVNLQAAQAALANKKNQVGADVRKMTRQVREKDAAKEVARLELQLAQQNVAMLQAKFDEGKVNLRDMEKARLDENDKWLAYLDANFDRQRAQLELLRTAGQLDKVME